jgi:hypothetical protein
LLFVNDLEQKNGNPIKEMRHHPKENPSIHWKQTIVFCQYTGQKKTGCARGIRHGTSGFHPAV